MRPLTSACLPGDELNVDVWTRDLTSPRAASSPLFAELQEILTPSADRVDGRCDKFFGVCGGCKHQNVRYERQLAEKQRRIEQLFASWPSPLEIRDIIGVSTTIEQYNYRNKMEFTCSTGRWLLESDKAGVLEESDSENAPLPTFTLGLFPVSSVGTRRARAQKKRRAGRRAQWNSRILSIDECALQDEACNRLLARVGELCESLGITAYDFHTHDGFLKNVVLRRGQVHDTSSSSSSSGRQEIMLAFVTTTLQDAEQQQRLDQLVATIVAESNTSEDSTSQLVSVIQRVDEEARRHRQSDQDKEVEETRERVLHGDTFFHDSILGHRFQISFDAFFQPNSAQATKLYHEIERRLESRDGRRPVVWDLFCGVGSIGICLGPHVERLVGFELVDSAVHMARRNAALNGYSSDRMQFHRLDLSNHWRDVETQLLERFHDPETRPDVIILDPPRAGLHKKLVALLKEQLPVPEICYVSCNPVTQLMLRLLLRPE
ncbi:hypothetical protein ATCC90586_006515 [Pythium insidiosum]|nr:hypothetical protein ATCC90586_006515 [Pythium insidiosum]